MSIKLRALAGASALAALLAAGAANAGDLWGGGSTLIAPYHGEMAKCWGLADFVTPPSTTFTPISPPGVTCTPGSDTAHYAGTGSGGAISGVYSHDRSRYAVTLTGWTSGSVQYGLSESALGQPEVFIYNNGGTQNGVTLSATPSAGQYPLPKPKFGPLVQFPLAIAPVALAYDPIYKKVNNSGTVTSYRFAVNSTFSRTNGGLRLDQTTYCKIVNGLITNWNDAAITTLNGGVSLKDPTDPDPFNVPIEAVGRAENSGTTQVITRHFAAACAPLLGSSNQFVTPAGTQQLPTTVQGPLVGSTPVSGKFTRATGSGGVATYVSFTDTPANPGDVIVRGRLGYIGADYTLPFAATNGLAYSLFTTDLQNASGGFRAPTGANATDAFSGNRPPQTATGATGNYDPSQTAWGSRSNPDDWVRLTNVANSVNLANPSPATAYPIVGTVNFLGYTCYANSTTLNTLRGTNGYLNFWFGHGAILTNAGLAPLPPAWQGAITNTFLAPTTTGTNPTAPLNLYFDVANPGGTTGNTNCTVSTIVGA